MFFYIRHEMMREYIAHHTKVISMYYKEFRKQCLSISESVLLIKNVHEIISGYAGGVSQ